MSGNKEKIEAERTAFWAALDAEAPELGIDASPGHDKEVPLGVADLKFKITISQTKTSVYLFSRSQAGQALIRANRETLMAGLRTTVGDATGEADQGRWFRKDNNKASFTIRRHWPEAIRWIIAQHGTFSKAIKGIETE